jgi:serine/threonine protein kinase
LPLRPAPRKGDVWDGFLIDRTIYHGRYTVLKLARDTIENRDVVLKIPLPSMLQDEVFSAGFMREAWIGSTVRGGNVARYIDLPPERRSSLYLVMPYYRGETLEQRLNRPPLMPLPDGVGIALKLCEAVQDLAAIQIVHRDLKPENVMLLEKNEVKLLDLGLAYLPGIDLRDAVKPGGTLRYMAPELLKGVQANARSEVYALAITIYRMFAGGAFPFGQREGTPLRRLRPDLPGWVGRIIQRALLDDPMERFADAGEMAKAFHEGLVSGMADEARERRLSLTKLQIWQAVAGVFAAGFFVLLLRALR